MGVLISAAKYTGQWNNAACKAHHQDSRGRYFPSVGATVVISLSACTLYLPKGTSQNDRGLEPDWTTSINATCAARMVNWSVTVATPQL